MSPRDWQGHPDGSPQAVMAREAAAMAQARYWDRSAQRLLRHAAEMERLGNLSSAEWHRTLAARHARHAVALRMQGRV